MYIYNDFNILNYKQCGINLLLPNLWFYPGIYVEEPRKNQEIFLVRLDEVTTNFLARQVPNKTPNFYSLF